MAKKYKIVVVGLGYVGLSNAVLLAQHHEVIGVDVSRERVDAINARQSPIVDTELTEYLGKKDLKLAASLDLHSSIVGADYVIVSIPTNYDKKTNSFDTTSVDAVIVEVAQRAPDACIVVKSTIPMGYIEDARKRLNTKAVVFSPEFLREGKALYDNLHPSRIVVGEKSERAAIFAKLLADSAIRKNVEIFLTGAREAEAIKLFSNAYLALRVAFFNELDSYALAHKMNSEEMIKGVSSDPRIGKHYNNPSFGYGGYCLPKDTKQLLANFGDVPQDIIGAIVKSNSTRKDFLAEAIISKKPKTVGVFRLIMKASSDNFRKSAIKSVIRRLIAHGIEVIVYEPQINADFEMGSEVVNDLKIFKQRSELVITNRMSSELLDIEEKVFTRDIFGCN